MNINSKFPTALEEVKQPTVKQPAKHGLMMILLMLLASTGFSIVVETPDLKVKILKEQSPLTEVVDLLDNLFN